MSDAAVKKSLVPVDPEDVKLITLARSAAARARGIAVLHDEARNDAMDRRAVEVTRLRERDEVHDRQGRVGASEAIRAVMQLPAVAPGIAAIGALEGPRRGKGRAKRPSARVPKVPVPPRPAGVRTRGRRSTR